MLDITGIFTVLEEKALRIKKPVTEKCNGFSCIKAEGLIKFHLQQVLIQQLLQQVLLRQLLQQVLLRQLLHLDQPFR